MGDAAVPSPSSTQGTATADDVLRDKLLARARGQVERWAGERGQGRRLASSEGMHIEKRATLPLDMQPSESAADTFVEPPRRIPVLAECDVLVVGAGPAGLSAAIGAARAGADVVLMERYGCFGGCITTVGMETLAWYRYEGTTDVEGIGIEMERLAAQMGGTVKFPYNNSECLDADFFKIVADHLVRSNGIRPLLHTYAVEALLEGRRIAGVITESKSGRQAIRAKRVVDCTGDADIAYMAGARYVKYEPEKMMGVTTVFCASGVDKRRFLEYTEQNPATYSDWDWGEFKQETTGKEDSLRSPYLEKEFTRAAEAGIIQADDMRARGVAVGGTWSALTDAGEATNLNLVHISGIDGTNVLDLTRAEMEGRRQIPFAVAAMKHAIPGFENAKLRNISTTLGVRDTRKIVGRHNLTREEVLGQARFDDAIGIFPEFLDGYAILVLPTTGRYFQVPYGILVSPDVDNLLVGGRCVAGDRASHTAMRNMMACTVTGQGAGVAAAVSVRLGVSTTDVDIRLVQEELVRQGVRIK